MIRDDEMYNSSVGVFYDAPHWKHPDFYSFLLLQRMFGSYQIDKHAEHLNDCEKQYNAMHTLLGNLVDVTRAECLEDTTYKKEIDFFLLYASQTGNCEATSEDINDKINPTMGD